MATHILDARISELNAQGMPDREIARTIGSCRSIVFRRRTALGLPAVPRLGRPKKATAEKKPARPAPTPSVVPPGGLGGGITKPATQMDRFLAAFERVEYARPEESERAKEGGRLGRLPAPPRFDLALFIQPGALLMERDLNGQMIPNAFEAAGRRIAMELAAMAQDAITAGAKVHRIDPVDLATHKPIAKWVRKDGMTGQRETWQRQLSGHKAGQKRKANTAPSNTSPTP